MRKDAVRSSSNPPTTKPRFHLAIDELLDRPIAFHRVFARITGSVNAALMLSQANYWTRRASLEGGWFWKTQDEWEEETALGRREQETARKTLRRLGAWHEELRGVPAKMHFRLDLERLRELLLQYGGNRQTGLAEADILEGRKAPNCEGGNRQASGAESAQHLLLSETTAETTQRGTLRETDGSGGGGHPPDTDPTAAAFRAFGFESKFGHRAFQKAVVKRAKELGNGNAVKVMEQVIQDCDRAVPPDWYGWKHTLEAEERKLRPEAERRAGANGHAAKNLPERDKLKSHITQNVKRVKKAAAKCLPDGDRRRLLQVAKFLEGIEVPAAPDLEHLENQLNAVDEKLFGVLADIAHPALMHDLRGQFREQINRGQARMNAVGLSIMQRQFLQKELLSEFKLRRLSLYHLGLDEEGETANGKTRDRGRAGDEQSGLPFGGQA
jgi:hypothetical protein